MALKKRATSKFTIVENETLNNKKISLRAKGLYSFLSSKPDSWNFSYKGLASQLMESEKQIRSAVKELVENDYLMRIPLKDKGSFCGWDWIINPDSEDLKLKYLDPEHNVFMYLVTLFQLFFCCGVPVCNF